MPPLRALLRALILSLSALLVSSCASTPAASGSVESRIERTDAGELILAREIVVAAPVARVWAAYTTGAGWEAWAAPAAEVDLRVGGRIRTHADPEATIGDPGTNTLYIVNYVPERLLTLRAQVSERWPDFMLADAEYLMNVLVFDPLDADTTRIRAWSVGYRDEAAYQPLLASVLAADEVLVARLVAWLESP